MTSSALHSPSLLLLSSVLCLSLLCALPVQFLSMHTPFHLLMLSISVLNCTHPYCCFSSLPSSSYPMLLFPSHPSLTNPFLSLSFSFPFLPFLPILSLPFPPGLPWRQVREALKWLYSKGLVSFSSPSTCKIPTYLSSDHSPLHASSSCFLF